MSGRRIYLGYPNARHSPTMQGWVKEALQAIETDPAWAGWTVVRKEYDKNCSLPINDVSAAIRSAVGPCVLLRPVQQRVFAELRERLEGVTVVLVELANSSADVLNQLQQARDQHLAGEPRLPRKLVIALLLVAKLERHQMWGGKNKGYMWFSDLAKGRGVAEEFGDQLPAVINDLFSRGMLIRKPSGGKKKYALCPQMRREIYEILRTRKFPDEVHRILSRDTRLASARHLDSVLFGQPGR